MSRDKQIEEMNNAVLAKYSNTLFLDVKDAYGALVDAGYRKTSEVAREIFAEIENGVDGFLKIYLEERAKECAIDTPLAEYLSGKIDAYSSVKFRLAELKKKYTDGEDVKSIYKHYTDTGAVYITSEPKESEDTE